MSLKVRTETVHFVDYNDLEDFAKTVYPFLGEYRFAAVQECGNDTDVTFNPSGKPDNFDAKEWKNVVRGGPLSSNYLLMDQLVRDGHIPAGTYVVRVSW